MTVFIDTSGWFASANRKDAHNARAKELIKSISGGVALVTSDFVLVETWLLLNSRLSFEAAHNFWSNLSRVGAAKIEKVSSDDLEHAWEIGRAFPDQELSIVDLTSFVLMERLNIGRVVSFDDDFVVYRYGPGRSKAFEVLR